MTLEQFKNLEYFRNTDIDCNNFIDTSENHTFVLDNASFDEFMNTLAREIKADFDVCFTGGGEYLIATKIKRYFVTKTFMNNEVLAQLLGENQIEGLYNLCMKLKAEAEEHKAKIIKDIKES